MGQKSQLLILSEYVNKIGKIGGTATEKMKQCLIFSRELFHAPQLFYVQKYSMTESSQ